MFRLTSVIVYTINKTFQAIMAEMTDETNANCQEQGQEEEKLFCLTGHFQQKEFVGQKSINPETETTVSGNSCEEFLANIWSIV